MSTANFGTPNYELPLIVGGIHDDGETEEDNEFLNEQDCHDVETMIEEFNEKLEHFEVFVEGGYYCGLYLNVKQTKDYLDYNDMVEWEEDDADYYYNMKLDELKAEFEEEMNKIKLFFANVKDELGFTELYKYAQFSNGEALYREVK